MSKAEEQLAHQIKVLRIDTPVREYQFHPKRRWRFDFAWPELKLAVEVEGITTFGKNKNGTMKLGRHQTATGLQADCEKYGEAMVLEWDVYRCTQGMIRNGSAIRTIQILINLKKERSGRVASD